jgi:hypothetical protein
LALADAALFLGNGEPRLWIMHLPHCRLGFTRIAHHRRVAQCLGSLSRRQGMADQRGAPGDLGDDLRPRVEDIAAFRVRGDRLSCTSRLGTPAALRPRRMPIRHLENLDTNRRDFTPCRFQSSAGTGSEPSIASRSAGR